MKHRGPASVFGALLLLEGGAAHAQCLTPITTFPYTESFEGSAAWVSGGTNSDWTWGAPAHPTINYAADGTNVWCVGGLTGSFYTNGQQSWLETPCFDLSTLTYPWIRFSIFWETEPNYDGVGLQYSPNGGVTWINVGEEGEAEDCHLTNWFNSTNITALNMASPRQGWSGTSTTGGCANGGGSTSYVQAAHCLTDLPTGDPVKFRFIFGAGVICNTFDGVAIDDFYIGEAPPLQPAFNFTCAGNTVDLQASGLAGCVDDGVWGFGDGSPTATGAAVSHTYAGPGSYTITFTMTSSCSAPVTVQRTVTIAELDLEITNVGCTPNTGAVDAVVTGSNGPFTYDWEPGGQASQGITGLGPGEYTVLVQSPDMCPLMGTATVATDGASLQATITGTDVSCNGLSDGSCAVTVTGGSGIYTYAWSPVNGAAATLQDLGPGAYTCTITDNAGCSTTVAATITEPTLLNVDASAPPMICAGEALTLVAVASGGMAPYALAWSPAGPDVAPTLTTAYHVVATDANGCESSPVEVTVVVGDTIAPLFSWDMSEGCAPVCVTFETDAGVAGERSWSFGDGSTAGNVAAPQHCYTQPGSYSVSLRVDADGFCPGTRTYHDIITVVEPPVALFRPSPEVAMIDDPTFHFVDLSQGATAWQWSFGDPAGATDSVPSPAFTFPGVGCFDVVLEVSNEGGCSDSTTMEVCVEDAFALYAPNAFSADGDLINDLFGVVSTVNDPADFLLVIHDRWGREIHSTTDPYAGWDGTGSPIGVYAWYVTLRDRSGDLHHRQGHVTLLR